MKRILLMAVSCLMMFGTLSFAADYRSGIQWEEPPFVEPGQTPGAPPSDAIVLFDGTTLDAWTGGPWDLKDGILTVVPKSDNLKTKQLFGSCQVHLEYRLPGPEGHDYLQRLRTRTPKYRERYLNR